MEFAWETTPASLFIGVQPGNEQFFEKLGFEKSIQSYQKKKARMTQQNILKDSVAEQLLKDMSKEIDL